MNILLVKRKILEMEISNDYSDIITEYLKIVQPIDTTSKSSINKGYSLVLKTIKKLWIKSGKNPSIFNSVKDFEPILQRQKKYRDHFIHSFNVFLLGYYLFNKLENLSESYFERSSSPNLTWMLTATFHDVGYPIQDIDPWINDIFQSFLGIDPSYSVDFTRIISPIHLDFIKMIAREHKQPIQGVLEPGRITATDWVFLSRLNENAFKKDHGLISAIMLAHQLWIKEGFLSADHNIYGNFLQNHIPACHAISCHTISKVKINFNKHPFAFLLRLCDELQEWGRPSTEFREGRFNLLDIDIQDGQRPKIIINIEPNIEFDLRAHIEKLKEHFNANGLLEIIFVTKGGEIGKII